MLFTVAGSLAMTTPERKATADRAWTMVFIGDSMPD
jgi:hypothetical protein